MRLTCILYGLSGFVSLGYQVVWFRIFVDRFGSSTLTFALVVCGFIGGLGVGSLLSARLASWIGSRTGLRHPLRVYGAIEATIAASILLTIASAAIPADLWGALPYKLVDGMYRPTWTALTARVATAAACVFAPCVLMGATFPLLCRTFSGDGRFPSRLYAWNTFGACLGVLACEFVWIPFVGHDRTLWVLIVINVPIGLYFLMRGGGLAPGLDSAFATGGGPEPERPPASEPKRFKRRPGRRIALGVQSFPRSVALACAGASGLLAGGLEADLFKRLWFVGCNSGTAMSFISLSAVLAIFLGSWMVHATPRLRLPHIQIAFVVAGIIYAATWRVAYPLQDAMLPGALVSAFDESIATNAFVEAGGVAVRMLQLLAYIAMVVIPAFMLVSLLLPYVCNRLQTDGRYLGVAYGLNTLMFCVGMAGFTWIAPQVNIFYSTKLFLVLFAVIVVFLLTLRETRRLTVLQPALAGIAVCVGAVVVPDAFDATYFRPTDLPARYPIRALRSNGAHTTYVVEHPGGDRLYFDNYSMSTTTSSAQQYMRLMAHFPLLAHAAPRQALLICFGVGNTASAIAMHETIDRIDVVELNDDVFATAPEFARTNQRVYEDPRLSLIHDDGRNFLRVTDRRYDLVTSEPPPPMEEGVYRLYAREYYQAVYDHLEPGGMMSQWLPVQQLPTEAVHRIVRTFVDVFPHALLFVGVRHQFILVGSNRPIEVARIAGRWTDSARVTVDLQRLALHEPIHMIARVAQTDRMLRRAIGIGPIVSDQHQGFAHLFFHARRGTAIAYDPSGVLEDVAIEPGALRDRLEQTLSHLGRLRWVVPDFPASSLQTVGDHDTGIVALAHVDWLAVDRLQEQAERAAQEGRLGEAITHLSRALSDSDEQPHVLLRLCHFYTLAGQYDAAIDAGSRAARIVPDAASIHHAIGVAMIYRERFDDAVRTLERARQLDPQHVGIGQALADVLARTGRFEDAIRAYDRVLALDPDHREAAARRAQVARLLARKRAPQ